MRKRDKLKNYEQANLMFEQSYLKSKGLLKEVDDTDFKLTELNPTAGEIRKGLTDMGLKVTVASGGKTIHNEKGQNSYIELFDNNQGINIGIGKDTNKAQEVLKKIGGYKDSYDIKTGQKADFWEIKMVKK